MPRFRSALAGPTRRLPARERFVPALLAGWLLAACAGGDAGETGPETSEAFRQYDSAGVHVSVTSEAQAGASLGWQVDSTPALVLGTGPTPADEFVDIAGARKLSGGHIAVLDRGSYELRFFDRDGTVVQRVGREGEGPGEFSTPRLVPETDSDSLLVWDVSLRRLHVFSPDGRELAIIRPPSWAGGRPPLGVADSRALVDHSAAPIAITQEEGVVERPARVFSWIDLGSGEQIAVHSDVERTSYMSMNPSGVPLMSEIPFSARRAGAVRGSSAWITDGVAPRIRVYDLDAALIREIRIDEERPPVTDGVLSTYIAMRSQGSAERRESFEELYDRMPIPETIPAFESILVDELGLVWAGRFHWDAAAPLEWVVFDEEGQALGTVTTPTHLDIFQIGTDFIVGVATDSLGVERIERYVLRRD